MRLTWLRFRREFASDWLSFQNESTGQDTIDASTLVSPANKALQDAYKHGVWIDAAEGNDTITGTDYSDNIKGGAGVDKIDGGKHLASTGQRGQDVFEIDLTTENFSSAQLLLSTVKISKVSEDDIDGAGYAWMIEVGTLGSPEYQKDYFKNIEAVSITVRDADNNWLTGKWVNTALNVGEVRRDPKDDTKTEWGTPLSEQNHFAWVNGTSADEVFDYTGITPGADTVSLQPEA